jgi:hypothetical protein
VPHNIVDTEGHLAVPLYHGTSTLFLESIVQFGLGGRSPLDDLGALEFFRKVSALCKKHLNQDDAWIAHEHVLDAIERQDVATFNFRHGSTYLTPSRLTARRYATSNEYGSELISTAFEWWTKLSRVKGLRSTMARLPSRGLLNLHKQARQPLIVRARGVPLASLRTEQGQDVTETLTMMHQTIGEEESLREGLWQQLNFELVQPIPTSELSFFVVAPRDPDDPGSPLTEKPWNP